MLSKNTMAMLITIGLAVVTVQADMSYAPFMFSALDASGSPIADGTYVMVLDLDGNGWQGNSYLAQSPGTANSTSWLWDANDMLMDRGQVIDGQAYPFKTISTSQIPAGYNANVDHYYILWFDTPYNAIAVGPGASVRYGAEDLGKVGSDPGDYTVYPNGGNASLTTISGPAPSWHNHTRAGDVNGDGNVTAADAMLIISKLNAEGPHALQGPGDSLPPPNGAGACWDVSDDTTPYISPLDALMVINELNGNVGAFAPQTVPEPVSLVLLAVGGLLLGRRRCANIR